MLGEKADPVVGRKSGDERHDVEPRRVVRHHEVGWGRWPTLDLEVDGHRAEIVGLNSVGLKRNGYDQAARTAALDAFTGG